MIKLELSVSSVGINNSFLAWLNHCNVSGKTVYKGCVFLSDKEFSLVQKAKNTPAIFSYKVIDETDSLYKSYLEYKNRDITYTSLLEKAGVKRSLDNTNAQTKTSRGSEVVLTLNDYVKKM